MLPSDVGAGGEICIARSFSSGFLRRKVVLKLPEFVQRHCRLILKTIFRLIFNFTIGSHKHRRMEVSNSFADPLRLLSLIS